MQVLNGSGVPGQASHVTDDLSDVGFVTEPPGDAGSYSREQTTIRFAPGRAAEARLLARHLKTPVAYEEVEDDDVDVTLVTAPDFTKVLKTAKPESLVPAPPTTAGPTGTTEAGTTTEDEGDDGGGDDGQSGATSTTVADDFVPDEPAPEGACR